MNPTFQELDVLQVELPMCSSPAGFGFLGDDWNPRCSWCLASSRAAPRVDAWQLGLDSAFAEYLTCVTANLKQMMAEWSGMI